MRGPKPETEKTSFLDEAASMLGERTTEEQTSYDVAHDLVMGCDRNTLITIFAVSVLGFFAENRFIVLAFMCAFIGGIALAKAQYRIGDLLAGDSLATMRRSAARRRAEIARSRPE